MESRFPTGDGERPLHDPAFFQTVLFGGRLRGSASHWEPVDRMWRIAFSTLRTSNYRPRPAPLAGWIINFTSPDSVSLRTALRP